jgi:hypothetical protein
VGYNLCVEGSQCLAPDLHEGVDVGRAPQGGEREEDDLCFCDLEKQSEYMTRTIIERLLLAFARAVYSLTTGAALCSRLSRRRVRGLDPSRRFSNLWSRRRLCDLLCV